LIEIEELFPDQTLSGSVGSLISVGLKTKAIFVIFQVTFPATCPLIIYLKVFPLAIFIV
jgi:hypothetical protein